MDHYAVIGNPIKHSQSPVIHQLFAAQTCQHLIYTKILAPLDGFAETIKHFVKEGGKGVNITLPFKQTAFSMLTNVSERALLAQAVNTLCFHSQDSWLGDNTDGIGLLRDLKDNLKVTLQHKRILILGAGGAVRGILGPLLSEQPKEIIIANRTVNKAEELATSFSSLGCVSACSLSDIPEQPFDIIINGISAGLQGEMPLLNPDILNKETFCYDLIYHHKLTPFLQFAKTQGVTKFADGLGMLVEQAGEAFYLWRGVKPDTQSVIAKLRPPDACGITIPNV